MKTEEVSVQYTSRSDIRKGVWEQEAGVQFDFAAWFDQITLHETVRRLFGVVLDGNTYALTVLPMGFRPSCQVAQTLSEVFSEIPSSTTLRAICVDNVLFQGDTEGLRTTAEAFVKRCEIVGALLNDPTVRIVKEYDFLGEHYNHTTRSRALTVKTQNKALYANQVLLHAERGRLWSTRQLLAIFGLLLYCSSTLRIIVAKYHWSMRFHSQVAASPIDAKHVIPAVVNRELLAWTEIAAKNTPVPAWQDEVLPDLEIFVDASIDGWGAISFTPEGGIMKVSERWTSADWQAWNLASSVAAEPLAMRKAVARLVTGAMKHVVIHTDHIPLYWAFQKGFAKAWSYSKAVEFLHNYNTQFTIQYVEGSSNPADVLSRHFPEPPLLHVTAIGGERKDGVVWG